MGIMCLVHNKHQHVSTRGRFLNQGIPPELRIRTMLQSKAKLIIILKYSLMNLEKQMTLKSLHTQHQPWLQTLVSVSTPVSYITDKYWNHQKTMCKNNASWWQSGNSNLAWDNKFPEVKGHDRGTTGIVQCVVKADVAIITLNVLIKKKIFIFVVF